jgi:hypothetical protein
VFSGNDFRLNYLFSVQTSASPVEQLLGLCEFYQTSSQQRLFAQHNYTPRFCALYTSCPRTLLILGCYLIWCLSSFGRLLLVCRSASKPVTLSPLAMLVIFFHSFQHINFLTAPRCHSDLRIPALVNALERTLEHPNPCSISLRYRVSLLCQASRYPCRLSALGVYVTDVLPPSPSYWCDIVNINLSPVIDIHAPRQLYISWYQPLKPVLFITVDSLITHSLDNAYSPVTHTFFSPPSWFAEKCTP